jgi:hypothetical protein
VTVDTDRIAQRRAAALAQPNARERANGAIKFACPACLAEGFDYAKDNAVYFPNSDRWSCAWADGSSAHSLPHWRKIAEVFGIYEHGNGSTRATPTAAPSSTPWARALSVPELLATEEQEAEFLLPRHLSRGAITEWYAPRGLGKTNVLHSLLVELARAGLRVLLIDRDNPRREVKRRLRAWGAIDAPTMKVIGRDHAPPLTDTAAWAAFPLDTYDIVAIDSLDASTEGVGEGDSAKPSKAFASVLDLARRRDGPALVVLGNTIKSGAHSRGSGVLEDRADIVYELRDATDLKNTGTKDWWHELAPAGVADWAARATRRKRRDVYKLAFIPTKFRLGEEPDPFCYEIDHRPTPWVLREVTEGIIMAGHRAAVEAETQRAELRTKAAEALAAELARRETEGDDPITTTEAVAFLVAAGLKRDPARALIAEEVGRRWRRESGKQRGMVLRATPLPGLRSPAAYSTPLTSPVQPRLPEAP